MALQKTGSVRYVRSDRRRKLTAALRATYGDTCWICNEPMLFGSENGQHPRHSSLEHIKPVREGGRCTLNNLRLTHRACNIQRGVDARRQRNRRKDLSENYGN